VWGKTWEIEGQEIKRNDGGRWCHVAINVTMVTFRMSLMNN
jgi:hypothetical protein